MDTDSANSSTSEKMADSLTRHDFSNSPVDDLFVTNDEMPSDIAVTHYDMAPFNEFVAAIDINSKEAVILKEISENELPDMQISEDLLKAISCIILCVKPEFNKDFWKEEKLAEFAIYVYRITNRLVELKTNAVTLHFLSDVFKIMLRGKRVLPSSNGLLVLLFFAFLYDEKDVIKALEEESHRSTLNRFFAKMLFFCAERPRKQQAPKVKLCGKFVIGLIKSYLENSSCSRQILTQFFADMPNFDNYPQKCDNVLDAYSARVLHYEKERALWSGKGALDSERSARFQKNLFPVLITRGYSLNKLLPHIHREKNWEDVERRLEKLVQGEALSANCV